MYNIYELYRGTLIKWFCFICVFAVLINKVSLQVTVHREGIIGGSVVLPCFSSEHHYKLQDIDVSWRHNDSEIVYDIVKGEDSLAEQDPRYKNRAETFPSEYERRNFSIRLKNLTYTDAGEFNCLITPSHEQENVELIIKEEKGNKSKQANQGPDWMKIISIFVGLLVSLVLIVVSIIAYFRWRKKSQAAL